MTNLADGMFETKYINKQFKVGNSTKITATNISKWHGVNEQKYGTKKNIVLDKVKLVLELWTNLFSIGSLFKKIRNLSNDGPIKSLSKNDFKFSFDQSFLTLDGLIMVKNKSGEDQA